MSMKIYKTKNYQKMYISINDGISEFYFINHVDCNNMYESENLLSVITMFVITVLIEQFGI